TVRVDGTVSSIENPEKGRNSAVLFKAAEQYLRGCSFTPGTRNGNPIDMTVRRLVPVHPPRRVDASEPPPVRVTSVDGIVRPRPRCEPPAPPPITSRIGWLDGTFVVHEDGSADDLTLPPSVDPNIVTLLRAWIEAC